MDRESALAIHSVVATVAIASIPLIAIVLVGVLVLAGHMTEAKNTLVSIDRRLDRIEAELGVAK